MRARGFSLVEVLVALAVFAALAAMAWGGLASVARTRGALDIHQQRLADIVQAMNLIERDLAQAIARPVRGNGARREPALLGERQRIELTRLGAGGLHDGRSSLERVGYALVDQRLQRQRYLVLDRAPSSVPLLRDLVEDVRQLRWRYLGDDGWQERWPAGEAASASLPRAVEMRLQLNDLGELRRVIELPSALPAQAPQDGLRMPGESDDDVAQPVPPPRLPPPPGGVE